MIQVDRGTLSQNAIADITIFDDKEEWIVKKDGFESKSTNSPFIGDKMIGRATDVIVNGKIVMENKEIKDKG